MNENGSDSLSSLENDIRMLYEAQKINQKEAEEHIEVLESKLGTQISNSQKLSTYKLIVDLIDLRPPAREKFELKIDYLKKVLELEPKNKEISSRLADLYELLWDHQNAIKYFQKTYELDPNPFYLFRIGMRYRLLYNNKSAIEYFNSCIEQGYEDSTIYREIGEAYFSIGDSHNAKFNLNKALYLGVDEENESRVNKLLSKLDEINSTTELINKFLRQKNSKPINPSYSSSDKGEFKSYKGDEFYIWRFPSEYEGTEVLRIYDNNSNAIGFWFGEKSNIILFGFVFCHQDSPDKIQYLVTIKPPRFEELDSNKMRQRENSEIMDPQKRNIDPLFAFKEYKKLKKYLGKAGIEIIPDFKDIFLKNKEQ